MKNCPTCGSHSPALHPAVQFEGEVHICPDPWHSSSNSESNAGGPAAASGTGHSVPDANGTTAARPAPSEKHSEYRYGLMKYKGGPNRIAAALLELVELKDMKDGFGKEPFGEHNNDDAIAEYEHRKPLAWNEARAALTEFFAASASVAHWIPVAERLPEAVYAGAPPQKSEEVLALYMSNGSDGPYQVVAHYWHDSKEWSADADEPGTFFEYATVTHWMPLPAAPVSSTNNSKEK